MKVSANSSPATMYLVERHPQVPEKAIVTLYDNVAEPDENGVYNYEAYQVDAAWSDNLTMEVAAHTAEWLKAAKSMDEAQSVKEAADATIAQNEAAIDQLLLLIGGDS